MRDFVSPRLKLCRAKHPLGHKNINDYNSAYVVRPPHDQGKSLFLIVSNGGGWDHVSVSALDSSLCPTWEDMCYVKSLFFSDDELVIQYHPPKLLCVDLCQTCLHLWRPQTISIPMPPIEYV